MIEALSKENIESGHSDSIYQNVERRRRAIQTLKSEKDSLSEELRELVVDRAGDVVSQPSESLSKEFIDDLTKTLEEQSGRVSNPPGEVIHIDGEYTIQFLEGDEDTTLSADSQSKLMGVAVNHLVKNHNLIEQLPDFPFIPGEKRAILNDQPEHADGEKMRLYQELDDGYYVYTALNKSSKKRYLEYFAGQCNLDIEFGDAW